MSVVASDGLLTGFSPNCRFDRQYLNVNGKYIMAMYIISQLQNSIHVTRYNYDQLDLIQLVRHRAADKRCTADDIDVRQTIKMYGR